MSRLSTAPSRNLTLTEELERLEQSITLTLQEIDHNFSRAHRIVTTSILPVVEQYAKHSEHVWEGSKFWKQFFEASANVSLSGYEEPQEEDNTAGDETVTQPDNEASKATQEASSKDDRTQASGGTASPRDDDDDLEDSSLLDSPSFSAATHTGTPRNRLPSNHVKHKKAKSGTNREPSFAEYSSPYEILKQEMASYAGKASKDPKTQKTVTSTPKHSHTMPTKTPIKHSPFLSENKPPRQHNHNPDPLLHRVLDKTYRIQATPHSARKNFSTQAKPVSAKKEAKPARLAFDSSPFSPPTAAPQLRSEIFGSALKAPRTPGVSVQKRRTSRASGGRIFSACKRTLSARQAEASRANMISKFDDLGWDSDSGDDGQLGISPPKTMQFHIPHSRLLQTPAREASKRIVEDLLLTAGAASITDEMSGLQITGAHADYGDDSEDEQYEVGLADDSPSVVRAAHGAGLTDGSPFGGS